MAVCIFSVSMKDIDPDTFGVDFNVDCYRRKVFDQGNYKTYSFYYEIFDDVKLDKSNITHKINYFINSNSFYLKELSLRPSFVLYNLNLGVSFETHMYSFSFMLGEEFLSNLSEHRIAIEISVYRVDEE